MLKSIKLMKQRKARSNLINAIDSKALHVLRTELYAKLEEELEENQTVTLEVPRDRANHLIEILEDDMFKAMYECTQLSLTLYEFKLKEIL